MKLATTTGDFALFTPSHAERLRHVYDAGFRYVDLSMYDDFGGDSPFFAPGWRDYTQHLGEFAENLGVTFVQAHSPGGNPLRYDESRQVLLDATIRSIEVCGILGIPNTVVHAGVMNGIGKEEYFERNLEFYRQLFPIMEKTGVRVLAENSAHAIMGERFYFYTGTDMREFIEYAGHPLLGVCWDTGHANMEGNQYKEILSLGDTLKAVHINDNRGKMDEHTIPYFGTVSMDEVMQALLDVHFDGYFTFECDSKLRAAECWIGNRRRMTDARPGEPQSITPDNRLAEPPLVLAKKSEELLYLCGKYILDSYHCFEE